MVNLSHNLNFNIYSTLFMHDPIPLQPLFTYFESFHPISASLKREYIKECKVIDIKKHKFIVSPLDHNDSLYFVLSGMVRGFIKNGKKDISTRFSQIGEIIGAIKHPEGMEMHSEEYLQAIDDCKLIKIPYSLVEHVYQTYPEAHIVGRKIFALQYYQASQRAIHARIPTAAARYDIFMNSGDKNLEKIPLRYLASYLGMRVETLSRIRTAEGSRS